MKIERKIFEETTIKKRYRRSKRRESRDKDRETKIERRRSRDEDREEENRRNEIRENEIRDNRDKNNRVNNSSDSESTREKGVSGSMQRGMCIKKRRFCVPMCEAEMSWSRRSAVSHPSPASRKRMWLGTCRGGCLVTLTYNPSTIKIDTLPTSFPSTS